MRQIPALLGLFLALGLAACSSTSDTGPSSPSAQLPAGNYKLGPPYKIKGRWYYLEHDWVAETGSYIFEPPGETHTLTVPDDCSEMITLFTVHGALMYVDPQGQATGYDDVFTRIDKYRAHFEAVGLGADHVRQFMR